MGRNFWTFNIVFYVDEFFNKICSRDLHSLAHSLSFIKKEVGAYAQLYL